MSHTKPNKSTRHHKQRNPWPLILFAVGGVLVIGAFFAFKKPAPTLAAIKVNGSPSLIVDQEKVDLGDVTLGKTVEVRFKLTNVGDQPLRFSNAPYVEVMEGC
jgi:hypothetical protein